MTPLTWHVLMWCLGCLGGFIDAWKRKVQIFIWLCCVLYVVVSIFLGGSVDMYDGMSNWYYLSGTIIYVLGFLAGRGVFMGAMKK